MRCFADEMTWAACPATDCEDCKYGREVRSKPIGDIVMERNQTFTIDIEGLEADVVQFQDGTYTLCIPEADETITYVLDGNTLTIIGDPVGLRWMIVGFIRGAVSEGGIFSKVDEN